MPNYCFFVGFWNRVKITISIKSWEWSWFLLKYNSIYLLISHVIWICFRLFQDSFLYPHSMSGGYIAITLSVRPSVRPFVRPFVHPSVYTFVTDISASTGRNDFIFDIWLWHGDLYRVSPFQVYRTSTSCLPCDLQMNEWGYS
jgi:hypothetical protein